MGPAEGIQQGMEENKAREAQFCSYWATLNYTVDLYQLQGWCSVFDLVL